jgi:hypothetical protein
MENFMKKIIFASLGAICLFTTGVAFARYDITCPAANTLKPYIAPDKTHTIWKVTDSSGMAWEGAVGGDTIPRNMTIQGLAAFAAHFPFQGTSYCNYTAEGEFFLVLYTMTFQSECKAKTGIFKAIVDRLYCGGSVYGSCVANCY